MSHLIDMSNNRANMAYTGETPWHGLGQAINPNAGIDEWRIAAGLDWHIEKRPLVYGVEHEGEIQPQQYEGLFAHVRSDTQEALGHGSDRFQLVQPGDTLEFYRDLVDGSRFTIETAGSLNGGRKLWALARCNLDLTLGDKDVLKPYLLLATANDGSMSTVADFTTVRVVCNNTLSMAVGRNSSESAIRVPHSTKFDANSVKQELGLIDGRLEAFAADSDRLTQVDVSNDQAVRFFADLYAKYDDKGEVANKKHVEKMVNNLMPRYLHGPGADLATARATAWGLVNAVTNFIDYEQQARSQDNRFASSQFGDGAKVKALAFERALDLAA